MLSVPYVTGLPVGGGVNLPIPKAFTQSNRHPLRPWPHGQLQVWIGKRQSGEWPERNRILPFRRPRVVF